MQHIIPAFNYRDAVMAPRSKNLSFSEESDSDASIGPQDEIQHFQYAEVSKPTSVSVVSPKKPAMRATLDDKLAVMTQVLSFLPLADLEAAREAGPLFKLAASRVAPRPLPTTDVVFYRYLPQTTPQAQSPMPIMPTHANSRRGVMHTAAMVTQQPAIFHWRCLSCGLLSYGPRQCNHCRAPLAQSACRVFLGQIRKDLSAEMAAAMIRVLAPSVNILHVESHTNGMDGRGKGCAWAYVDSIDDAIAITALHKRVFVDLDGEEAEGFWFVKDAALVPQLAAMAEAVSAERTRPQWLPRQPLVAELPSKSIIARIVAGAF